MHATEPSRAEGLNLLSLLSLLSACSDARCVTHKCAPGRIPVCFIYATCMISQSEASNAWAAGAAQRDTPAAEVCNQPLANQEPGMRERRARSAKYKQPR